MAKAKFRYTRKNENPLAYPLEEILPTDEPETFRFVWRSMTNELLKMGFKSRWEIQIEIDGEWEGCGELYTCSKCGAIYPVMPGNVYDGIERCEECGAEFDED